MNNSPVVQKRMQCTPARHRTQRENQFVCVKVERGLSGRESISKGRCALQRLCHNTTVRSNECDATRHPFKCDATQHPFKCNATQHSLHHMGSTNRSRVGRRGAERTLCPNRVSSGPNTRGEKQSTDRWQRVSPARKCVCGNHGGLAHQMCLRQPWRSCTSHFENCDL